jgi:hypothetical protein
LGTAGILIPLCDLSTPCLSIQQVKVYSHVIWMKTQMSQDIPH